MVPSPLEVEHSTWSTVWKWSRQRVCNRNEDEGASLDIMCWGGTAGPEGEREEEKGEGCTRGDRKRKGERKGGRKEELVREGKEVGRKEKDHEGEGQILKH